MGWCGSGRGKEFGEENPGKDQYRSGKRAVTQAFSQKEKGDNPGEDWFEGKEKCGVGGGEVLLCPTLNGEGRCCGEKAGNGQRKG